MGYLLRRYSIPEISDDWAGINDTTARATTWLDVGPIPKPSVAFTACWDGAVESLEMTRQNGEDLWSVSAILQLADEDEVVRWSTSISDHGWTNYFSGGGYVNMSKGALWTTKPLTLVRVALTFWRVPSNAMDLSLVVPSSTFLVFEYTTSGGAPTGEEAIKDSGCALPVVVSGGEDRRKITRLRYKFVQSADGEMVWQGRVAGNRLHKLT